MEKHITSMKYPLFCVNGMYQGNNLLAYDIANIIVLIICAQNILN